VGVCAARLTMLVSFRRLAFDTTMPTACKHLVCASVFGELPIPLGKCSERFTVKLRIRCGNFKGVTA
jgi:hypothetical protein